MPTHLHSNPPENPKYREIVNLLHSGAAHAAGREARTLAEEGDGHAHALLGAIFEFGGLDLEPDPAAALKHYRKAIDMCGSAEGCLGAARMMYLGRGVSQDLKEAFIIYRTTADLGSEYVAQYMTAKMYLYGEGVQRNYLEAERYARLALTGKNIHAFELLAQISRARGQHVLGFKWWLKSQWAKLFLRPVYFDRKI